MLLERVGDAEKQCCCSAAVISACVWHCTGSLRELQLVPALKQHCGIRSFCSDYYSRAMQRRSGTAPRGVAVTQNP